jgi:hypothetical protein
MSAFTDFINHLRTTTDEEAEALVTRLAPFFEGLEAATEANFTKLLAAIVAAAKAELASETSSGKSILAAIIAAVEALLGEDKPAAEPTDAPTA